MQIARLGEKNKGGTAKGPQRCGNVLGEALPHHQEKEEDGEGRRS